jgi:hypothetical protein
MERTLKIDPVSAGGGTEVFLKHKGVRDPCLIRDACVDRYTKKALLFLKSALVLTHRCVGNLCLHYYK